MPSRNYMKPLALASGAIFSVNIGYVFSRPSKQKNPSLTSLPLSVNTSNPRNSSQTSLSLSVNTAPIPTQKKFLKNPFRKFKFFRSKGQKPTVMMLQHELNTDDDASSILSDSTSVYTITGSSSNLPGTLPQAWESSTSMNTNEFSPRNITGTIEEEEEEDGMEWCSVDEEPIKARPLTVPISPRKKHNRCISLPPPDFANSLFYHHQRPSECWDDEFLLEDDLVIPPALREAQIPLRLNISTIRDFIRQVEELKVLRDQRNHLSAVIQSKTTRKWKQGFTGSKSKKHGELEKKFRSDWEKADVIIDLSEVTQDKKHPFDKSIEVDVERIPSKRHMQVLKTMMEATDLTSVADNKENHCDCYHGVHCKKHKTYSDFSYFKKHKNYGDHGHNAKKQKLTDENEEGASGGHVKKRKENFRIDVEMMPSLVEHLKELQKRLSGHVSELEILATLITLTNG